MLYKVKIKIQNPSLYGIFDSGFYLTHKEVIIEAENQIQAMALVEQEYGKKCCLGFPLPQKDN